MNSIEIDAKRLTESLYNTYKIYDPGEWTSLRKVIMDRFTKRVALIKTNSTIFQAVEASVKKTLANDCVDYTDVMVEN